MRKEEKRLLKCVSYHFIKLEFAAAPLSLSLVLKGAIKKDYIKWEWDYIRWHRENNS